MKFGEPKIETMKQPSMAELTKLREAYAKEGEKWNCNLYGNSDEEIEQQAKDEFGDKEYRLEHMIVGSGGQVAHSSEINELTGVKEFKKCIAIYIKEKNELPKFLNTNKE